MQRADYGEALEAARRWITEHGRYPQQQEWEHWAQTTRLPGLVVILGSATLVALVLIEGAFTVTWATASVNGPESSALAGFDQQSSFIHIFPIGPAPAVYLPLGAILLTGQILPKLFAYLALALGLAFVIVGFIAVFVPLASAVAGVLSFVQDVWILAAAAALLLGRGRKVVTVSSIGDSGKPGCPS